MNLFEIKEWLLLDTNCHVPTLNGVTLGLMLLRQCDSEYFYHEGDLKKKTNKISHLNQDCLDGEEKNCDERQSNKLQRARMRRVSMSVEHWVD